MAKVPHIISKISDKFGRRKVAALPEDSQNGPREENSPQAGRELEGALGGNQGSGEATPEPNWAELVNKIIQNDPSGPKEVRRVFCGGVRYYFCRYLGPDDLENRVRNTLLIVAQGIRRGELGEPAHLSGYVLTIARGQVNAQIADHSRNRQPGPDRGHSAHDPARDREQDEVRRVNGEAARKVLKGMSSRDREIMMRFYLREESADQICSEMGITEGEFCLLKAQAKARFERLSNKRQRNQAPVRENPDPGICAG
jgi:DNA-directed RNA polymerase specialized sigma24 family protein